MSTTNPVYFTIVNGTGETRSLSLVIRSGGTESYRISLTLPPPMNNGAQYKYSDANITSPTDLYLAIRSTNSPQPSSREDTGEIFFPLSSYTGTSTGGIYECTILIFADASKIYYSNSGSYTSQTLSAGVDESSAWYVLGKSKAPYNSDLNAYYPPAMRGIPNLALSVTPDTVDLGSATVVNTSSDYDCGAIRPSTGRRMIPPPVTETGLYPGILIFSSS